MPSIQKSGDKWRAQIAIMGKRESRSFRTQREASAWAHSREASIKNQANLQRDFEEKFYGVSFDKDVSESKLMSAKVPVCNFCGVYFLLDNNKIVYIGKSTNIISRVSEHAKKGRSFSHYYAIPCSPDSVNDLEKEMIRRFMPEQNKEHKET